MAAKLLSVPSLKNGALNAKELPSTIKVLNWGANKTLKGVFVVDERTLRVFDDNQKQAGWDTIALDYEHNTVPGTTAYKESAEPRPVAAHLSCSVVPYEGMFCQVKDWTPGPTGGLANAKNYSDLSAAPIAEEVNGEFVVIGLHSVAMTQHGASDAQFLSSDFPADLRGKIHTLSASFNQTVMNKEHIATFRALLGMDDAASDEEVLSAMSDKIKKKELSCRTGPLDNAGGTTPKVETFSAEAVTKIVNDALKPLSEKIVVLSTAADATAKAADKAQRKAILDGALAQHKAITLSSEALDAMPIASLEALVKEWPVSPVATKRSPQPMVKQGASGRIQGSPAVTTLAVNGVPVTLSVGSTAAPEPKINATKASFQEQFNALNGR